VRPHNRFVYFAYWRGVGTPGDQARVWMLNPDGAAVFPNEDHLTVIAAVPHKARLGEFRPDPEAAYERWIRALPEGPDLGGAERASKLIGKLEMPNKMRPAARPGIAFVGDAALATDPLFGVGCGWAFQTAEWLVEETAEALLDEAAPRLDAALRRYARTFLRRLGPHHLQIADFSTGRPLRANERIVFRAAARDPVVAAAIEEVVSRRCSTLRMLDPRPLPRVLWQGVGARGPGQ
jgi:2-polyprenyl-6-methoxyphenol hydroxylase-like FAD-dependent oxidoreductase